MSHNHYIVDTGKHFVIDPLLRTITTETRELVLSQGDHNSERYTFEIPRMVEGHDMSLCNRIEVHYDNISKNKKETHEGFYIVEDVNVSSDTMQLSWLISGNATRLFGSLQFWINFICVDEGGNVIYSWGTDIFKGVRILANNRNTDNVVAVFPDVLDQWKNEVSDIINSAGESHISYLVSPDDKGSIISLRDLVSGVYVLNGRFYPYDGAASVITFPNNVYTSVERTDSTSCIQSLIPNKNVVKYLEISDASVYQKDVELSDVVNETRVTEMIDEALGDFSGGSTDDIYVLQEDENINNAPEDAVIVIDPYHDMEEESDDDKIDRSEITTEAAIEIVTSMGLVSSVVTDENRDYDFVL